MRQIFEKFQAIFDIFPSDVGEAVGGKRLTGKRGRDGAVNHRLADVIESEFAFPGGSKVAGEGTEEGIARAGGIRDLFERESSAAEQIEILARQGEFSGRRALGVLGKQNGAQLTQFDDHALRAFIEKGFSGNDEIGSFAKIPRLGLIDHEKVDFLEDFVEIVVRDGDPEIHGIGRDERLGGGELLDHLKLVDRVHVGQYHDRRRGHVIRDFSSTLMATESVSRSFMFSWYSPDHEKVSPSERSSPRVEMFLDANKSRCS